MMRRHRMFGAVALAAAAAAALPQVPVVEKTQPPAPAPKPPVKWDEAMGRQPRAVQAATFQNHERYGAAHATRADRIRAGKR